MRLWHYKLIDVLPQQMLVSQWREVIAIKRQWERGTLKHRLVSYIKNYDRVLFYNYVSYIVDEMNNRKIKYQDKFFSEIIDFCSKSSKNKIRNYPEHNERYLKQCYYNLQEKYDREIIKEEEWKRIQIKYNKICNKDNL